VLTATGALKATVTVTKTGQYDGVEIVQWYVRDHVGSVTRPLKELKGFNRIELKKGESKKVEFTLTADQLAFHRLDMSFGTEPGDFSLFAGGNSKDLLEARFVLR
jgi:beta-glucosidase